MADCAALELLCAGNGTGGSNPPLSALLIGSHRKSMAPFFLRRAASPILRVQQFPSVQACLLNSAPARFEIVVQAYVPVPESNRSPNLRLQVGLYWTQRFVYGVKRLFVSDGERKWSADRRSIVLPLIVIRKIRPG